MHDASAGHSCARDRFVRQTIVKKIQVGQFGIKGILKYVVQKKLYIININIHPLGRPTLVES